MTFNIGPATKAYQQAPSGRRSPLRALLLDYRHTRYLSWDFLTSLILPHLRIIMLPRLTLSILLFLTIVILSEGCESDQMRYGCRIYNAQCSCGYGCKSEYRYDNSDDCKLALKGKRSDTCIRSKPCLNRGSCSQISSEPGFKCRCEGTGFYGTYCEKRCPTFHLVREQFPYECVEI